MDENYTRTLRRYSDGRRQSIGVTGADLEMRITEVIEAHGAFNAYLYMQDEATSRGRRVLHPLLPAMPPIIELLDKEWVLKLVFSDGTIAEFEACVVPDDDDDDLGEIAELREDAAHWLVLSLTHERASVRVEAARHHRRVHRRLTGLLPMDEAETHKLPKEI